MNKSQPDQRIKRRFSLRFALVSLLVIGVVGTSAYFWHAHQLNRLSSAMLQRADQLERDENWREAADYFHRYLSMHPGDEQVWIRLAKAFDKSANSYKRRTRAVEIYFRAIAVAPDRVDLRSQLCELMLGLGQFAQATEQTEKLLALESDNIVGLRVQALALYGEFLQSADAATVQQTKQAFDRALSKCAGDIQLVQAFAEFHREHLSADAAANHSNADDAMDRLVEVGSEKAAAHLARYYYRRQYGLPGADDDLAAALRLSPDQANIVFAAAEDARRRGEFEQAKQKYQQLVADAPRTARAHLGLGQCFLADGEINQAIETWRKGLKADSDNVALNVWLANALIQQRKLKEAESCISALDRGIAKLATQSADAGDAAVVAAAILVRAKWHLANRDRPLAVAFLNRLVHAPTVGDEPDTSASPHFQAFGLLGQIYQDRNEPDVAAVVFERAVALWPSSVEMRLAASRAWAAAGELEKAIQLCGEITMLDRFPPETWLLLAELQSQQQLRMNPEDQNWPLVLKSLAQAERALPNSWKPQLLMADVLTKQGTEESKRTALKILASLEANFADTPGMWQNLALAYLELGKNEGAGRAVDEFEKRSGASVTVELLRVELLLRQRRLPEAKALLRAALRSFDQAEHRPILAALAHLERQAGESHLAKQHLRQLADADASDVGTVWLLADLALEQRDYVAAEQWEKRLRELEGLDGSYWRMCRARRLLAQANSTEDKRFREAVKLQAETETRRPSSSESAVLKGIICQRKGNAEEAIGAYQRAIQLGTRRFLVYEQLARLLMQNNRLADAEPVLRRTLELEPNNHEIRRVLATLLASRGDDKSWREALELLDAKSQDAEHAEQHRRLAALLSMSRGKPDDLARARSVFESFVAVDPEKVIPQDRLILSQIYEREKNLLAARKQFEKLLSRDDPERPTYVRQFADFLIRNNASQEALSLLTQAVEKNSGDAQLLFALANLHLREGRSTEAIENYERVTQVAPTHVSAWNNLANLLAEDPQQRERALRCVERAMELVGSESPTLIDTKATVLLHLGRASEAIELLQPLTEASHLRDPRFHLHLAIAFQRTRDVDKCREALQQARSLKLSEVYLTEWERGELSQLESGVLQ